MASWRTWFGGGRRRRGAGSTAIAQAADVWERAGKASTASLPIMAKVEKLALQVYSDHHLPTQPGHYRRGPSADGWVFLGEHVDAEARWSMLLASPPEQGWRYATLEDIGRFPGAPPELQAASNILSTCRHLKGRLLGREPGEPGDDIQTAIRLGIDWRELQDLMTWRETSKLKLTTPTDTLPLAEPKTAAAHPPGEPRPPAQTEAADAAATAAKPPRKPRAPRKKKTPETT